MVDDHRAQDGGSCPVKITITSTNKLTTIEGVPCRIWEGVTERGVPCHVFVHRLAVQSVDNRCEEFERELRETYPPTAELIPLPLVLLEGDDPLDAA